MRFAALGSGSKGNGLLVESGTSCVLVDCGFSVRETVKRLALLGRDPAALSGILVTHEHSDHSKGVRALAAKFQLDVYASFGTASHKSMAGLESWKPVVPGEVFAIGELSIEPVTVPHDAREPCQFIFEADNCKFGLLTDLGHISVRVKQRYGDCHGLFIEANHDESMLAEGPYPLALKRRVGGNWGHLSNRQTLELLRGVCPQTLQQLVLGHISEKNNCGGLVADVVAQVDLPDVSITYAQQDAVLDWIELN